uniref:Uncharacterized protein n=1 Tax=Arundo donax TaxID=35708 RepID=A0A0A8ZJ49_ARUDO
MNDNFAGFIFIKVVP